MKIRHYLVLISTIITFLLAGLLIGLVWLDTHWESSFPILTYSLFAIVIFAILIASALNYYLKVKFIEPLDQIHQGMCSLKNQDFSHRLNLNAPAELELIASCFNQTASALETDYGKASRKEKQYRTLIENIPQKVFLKDLEGRYKSCNDAFAVDLQLNAEEIEGLTDFDIFPENLANKYRRDDQRIISTGLTDTFEEQYSVDGKVAWVQITKTPVFDQSNAIVGVLGIFFDITETKKKEQIIRELNENLEIEVENRTRELHDAYKKMEELSVTDALTGLSNKRHFEESADLIWRRSRRSGTTIGILMIDIDSFKNYNDNYGHVQGDEAIKVVAECIHLSVKRPEDLAARFGGEEFVILLSGIDQEGLIHVAERLRAMLEARKIPHAYSDAADWLTLSVGAYLCKPSSSGTFGENLKKADEALYTAKRAGRNQLKVVH